MNLLTELDNGMGRQRSQGPLDGQELYLRFGNLGYFGLFLCSMFTMFGYCGIWGGNTDFKECSVNDNLK